MRTMYDAVNPANLPPGGDLYAGYADGRYANVDAIWARFPWAKVVTITVFGHVPADVIDVEAGDATPAQAVEWVKWMRSIGRTPTVYCPRSIWLACIRAFRVTGTPQPNWWIAQYDNDPTIPDGAIAKQHGGDTAGGFDVSSVADYWPGIDQEEQMLDQSDKDFISAHFGAAVPPVPYEEGSLAWIIRNRNAIDAINDKVLAAVRDILTNEPVLAAPIGVAPSNTQEILDALAARLQS